MREIFQPLLFLLARSTEEDLRRQNQFLKAENEFLRKRVPKQRIFLEPHERERLLKLGQALGPGVRHVITIVAYSTFRRWARKAEGKEPAKKNGRPRIGLSIREAPVSMRFRHLSSLRSLLFPATIPPLLQINTLVRPRLRYVRLPKNG